MTNHRVTPGLVSARPPVQDSSPSPGTIRAVDLSFTYEGSTTPTFSGVSFEVVPGECLLIVGASGSGKSTLALALAGLVPREVPGRWSGRLEVSGLNTVTTSPRDLAAQVGIVFQDPESQLVMERVEDDVAFGLENRAWPLANMQARVPEVLAMLGLQPLARRRSSSLSGGQQQRLALAGVLAPYPGILVLDEPTANLDPEGTQTFFEQVRRLREERSVTLVLIEHRVALAWPLADRVLVLGRTGAPIDFGTPEEVLERSRTQMEAEGIWLPDQHEGMGEGFSYKLPDTPPPLATEAVIKGVRHPRAQLRLSQKGQIAHFRHPREGGDPLIPSTYGVDPRLRGDDGPLLRPPQFGEGDPLIPSTHGVAPPVQTGRGDDGKERINPPPLATLSAVTFGYDPRQPILDTFSLEVMPGERIALLGPNGSGKSTLCRLLVGLLKPTRGKVQLAGTDPARLSAKVLSSLVGYVFQDPERQFLMDTVRKEVLVGLPLEQTDAAHELMATLGLPLDAFGERSPYTLSWGEKRRLSLGCMLVRRPRLLVLDEPTFGQDRRGYLRLLDILHDHVGTGTTVIAATHDLRFVRDFATRHVVLQAGKVNP